MLDVAGNVAKFNANGSIDQPKRDLFFLLLSICSLVLLLVYVKFRKQDQLKFVMPLWVIMLVVLLVIPEVILRKAAINLTYSERNGETHYISPYGTDDKGLYHKFDPGKEYVFEKQEFTERKEANSFGFIDKEWSNDRKGLTIASFGDSFTEGVGADRPWVEELGMLLSKQCGQPVNTMNAGVSGHDPLMSYYALENDLLSFEPDIVMFAINSTDIDDIMLRGCNERYVDDGSSGYIRKAKPHPNTEYLYAISHTFRAFVSLLGYNSLLMTEQQTQVEKKEAISCITSAMKRAFELSKQKGFKLVVIIHPMVRDIESGNMDVFDEVRMTVDQLGCASVYLWTYYTDTLGIDSSNMFDHYWPMDRHQKDYKIFAEGVLNDLGCEYFAKADSSTN